MSTKQSEPRVERVEADLEKTDTSTYRNAEAASQEAQARARAARSATEQVLHDVAVQITKTAWKGFIK